MAATHYDLVVIGGGSGGLAASKEAASLGKKVACLDFVTPSPAGTTWGLGGTCVNVGCIPKKLMHQAGILGEGFSDAREFGWQLKNEGHNWEKLVTGVQDHIGSTNFGYRVQLRDAGVTYLNARGVFTDPNTIVATKRNGKTETITADTFIIAVGGRPKYLGVEGDEECCITSDDIFSKLESPGKVLCIGASYISLETAGFLTALGYDTSVMCRSVFLRGFDQEISEQIVGYMERHGTKMLRSVVPTKFEKVEGGKTKVTYTNTVYNFEASDVFDTVILAVGRDAVTKDMGLDKAGVIFDKNSGKIPATNEQTNVPHIYAIGDVLEARQELTPVAIMAGQRLARRLYAGSTETMDYNLVPTTVFTPLEYGCVGMSEELAVETYGADNVDVYVSYFKPLEWATNHEENQDGQPIREDNACYAKMIVHIPDGERVIGVHHLGPNAGEVIQGIAVAVKLGAKKSDFDNTVGIHPTLSEEYTTLSITKRSGKSAQKAGC
mmetsp:Transcript_29342/g.95609  ORF Transcript_29342/g.95609 Transcript_29342/m.95609 type:complete len:495 (+) Transcript_29342:88-1572(+)|eukprot:CAMPEP_0170136416 /NCGR_PEP_ID=MMETSP0033_2-20121228/3286_1 /TAXON_ID=195969 /ORGANISM="Dolichomastix tenuilepis, Strain CCMP3274" /LENGTH=494 /DNA_ID=CAMNT_0010372129 /DNA_START=45 /DNA_END=1529 /DNA_ORIENTATION=+